MDQIAQSTLNEIEDTTRKILSNDSRGLPLDYHIDREELTDFLDAVLDLIGGLR